MHRGLRRFSSAVSSLPSVLQARSTDIHFNLATESFFIEALKRQTPTLFLWRNAKTIVIGRHQNAWKECDVKQMEGDGVKLARRYSGGGAVYQDHGNTCFTFLGPASSFSKERNNALLLEVLREDFGIRGEVSGRNDLIDSEGKRKFSGAAYRHLGDFSLHHGTVLMDVDMQGLSRYLTPNKLKLQSKGVQSVASRVVNLKNLNKEICHHSLCEALTRRFLSHAPDVPEDQKRVLVLEEASVPFGQDPLFLTHLQRMRDWNWAFGASPSFSHCLEGRVKLGTFEVNMQVEEGLVKDVRVFSDCLYPDLVEELERTLRSARYSGESLKGAVGGLGDWGGREGKMEDQDWKMCIEELGEWLYNETVG
uniref:lipoate--protein ligase n=1 Tax=Chromera velia CCMP2878 TaxID=1169474 RepID=A0A0G4HAG3_9ALVE|eukprot:Cvel_25513.t1-p1 / transcript=Cvel_25513.t1 / gene=Cvel_25513 / organism=Chromera_velia_CCMP2878 / gene_product=Lipoate-protein ligase A, putative / transcript_product=Lipoate-protein ligase A, putative / location=Cvel_scaffold2903:3555-5792(-) / protein_length=364 / sequence_SO=supercontig / SO=protein_coding / is_pseudo=false